MKNPFEFLLENEMKHQDARYLEILKRFCTTMEMAERQDQPLYRKLKRKIIAVEGVNNGSIRFQDLDCDSLHKVN